MKKKPPANNQATLDAAAEIGLRNMFPPANAGRSHLRPMNTATPTPALTCQGDPNKTSINDSFFLPPLFLRAMPDVPSSEKFDCTKPQPADQ
jgi:hypothetical protein